ncbi:ethanolamine ammonia-lyase subunit EutC [Chelatococcus reniformis]|uniref:Ethanolamine ammonia-lyase small subunit n=1 Tax=Chelatococcus reniformis TaxID=1494448 RepID=A0A916U9E8_9HYPH|nr:ethanolamine ammonia-lyase subunit EutC [Chelatococcus reniformis]GGC64044.1 ethanolamine ammonia-lyase light chain [Chelatococcus reniformis]
MSAVVPDPWARLAALTPARIALGRVGASLPTGEALRFALAHARARDAVHVPLDVEQVATAIRAEGFQTLSVASAAPSRPAYLVRPDLGRRLSDDGRAALRAWASSRPEPPPAGEPRCDLAIVVADGLSSAATQAHAAPLLACLRPLIAREGWTTAPVVVATQARVALGDAIGEAMGARAVAVLIGERPGLSAPDSLGVYLTFAPRVGRSDGERNCISNIHGAGLPLTTAATRLVWLLREAFVRRLTGVALKDESDLALVGAENAPTLSRPP